MSNLVKSLRRFWLAEEVPRWFGLSVFLIYLAGLTGVAYVGVQDVRHDVSAAYWRATEEAFGALSGEVTVLADDPPALHRTLRDFAGTFKALELRLIGPEQGVLASIDASEEGAAPRSRYASAVRPRRLERLDIAGDVHQEPVFVYRAPLNARPAEAADAEAPPDARYLEMVVPQRAVGAVSMSDFAGPLSVVLAGCGALLLAYRRLRRQWYGMSLIAHQLAAHGGRIEGSFNTMRLADEADALAQQWNGLVSLVESLSAEVKRSQASSELSKALAQVSGGALRQALHSLPDSLLFLVEGGRIEYANAAARRLLNLVEGTEAFPAIDDVQADGAGSKCAAVVKAARGEAGQFETRAAVVETDDHETFLRVRVLPLRGGDGASSCLVMISDVSQQIRADKAREEFVSTVTHELRTPLTNIRAYTETLASGMFEDPKIVTECYNVITKETRRLARLIDDMLNVSQMEVGTIQLAVDELDLRGLLTDAVRDVRGLAEEKQIDLRLTLPAKLEPIRADKDKLNVVLNNLLGNALKYTSGGGTVVVGAQISGDKVMITVKDNGIGISPKDQQRVFEKFARGDDPLVREQTGTGVGLYTAREIVRRHGGEIELMSAKGEGSTFIVRLPHEPSRAGV